MSVRLTLCLGSSCFARGNLQVLDALKALVAEEGLPVELAGCRCAGRCRQGPNLLVGGSTHEGLTPEAAVALARSLVNG